MGKLTDYLGIILLLKYSIYKSEEFIEKLGELVILSEGGQKVKGSVISKFPDVNEFIINYCIFLKFSYNKLLIDIDKTDIKEIENIVSINISNSSIIYPWRYDNILYNKYFETIKNKKDSLEYNGVIKLLESTPQGVYQINNIIVGPFGILKSNESRCILPTDSMHLWHCSNPSCNIFHNVRLLKNTRTENSKILSYLDSIIPNSFIDKLLDENVTNIIFPKDTYYDDLHLGLLPIFIGCSFSERETKSILSYLMDSNRDFRKYIQNIDGFNDTTFNIVNKLNKSQCLQLILICESPKIVYAIESLIDIGEIVIPATEIRNSIFIDNRALPYIELQCECSKYGLRVIPRGNQIGLLRLKYLLHELYSTEDEIKELFWLLNRYMSDKVDILTVYESLNQYIFKEDISKVIESLIFNKLDKTQKAIAYLRFGNFNITNVQADKDYIMKKIIWKLGFKIKYYPDDLEILWKRYNKLLKNIDLYNNYNEDIKEMIRSGSVNFFVSLEEFLQKCLSYMCWALLSDHYKDTKFKYNYEKAKESLFTNLNNYKISDNMTLVINSEGKDTLYPLIEGFSALALLCEKLLSEKDNYLKPEEELPSNYNVKILKYSLFHKHLILDLELRDAKFVIDNLRDISNKLKSFNTCTIRNSTNHQRDTHEFPSKDTLTTFMNNIRSLIKSMENLGAYPMVYTGKSILADNYCREYWVMTNYKGELLNINYVEESNYLTPSFDDNQIISPIIKLNGIESGIRFFYTEVSEFTKMYSNFPRREIHTGIENTK